MGFLVCNKCGGYYELQEGESQDDFDLKCECGGILEYVDNLNDQNNEFSDRRKNSLRYEVFYPGNIIIPKCP